MTAAAKTTTTTAAAMRPHGRLWALATTCVGGRVRPPLPPARARLGLPPPDRVAPPLGRASSGLRSLAKTTPRCGVHGARASLGCEAGRSLQPPGGGAGTARGGQYARAVTPEQLQDVVGTAVRAVVDRGALPVEVPAAVVIE